jgi:Ca-activated chloride channel family protein
MIELAFPWALLLLPTPWLVWRFAPPRRERMPALRFPFFRRLAEAAGSEPQEGSVVLRRRWVQIVLALVVWTALVVALARPERVGEPIEVTKAARDVLLAIDISGSMDERDFPGPDGSRVQRLEAVKRVVGRFIEEREGDRVALIVFGSKAFVQSPFTEDLRTVRELLDQTQVAMAGPNTVIGDAIGLAIRTFESSEIQQRLLILLGDGADTDSRMSPINAATIAAQNGVEIFTVGVGDPEGTGQYFFAADEAGLEAIYARIDEMRPRKIETLSYRPRESLGHWPLAAATLIAMTGVSGLQVASLRRRRS